MTLKIGILVTNGFEESELESPKQALEMEGWTVHVISPEKDKIKSWKDNDWGEEISVDKRLEDASSSDYDALILPGGVISPDELRVNKSVLSFVKEFFEARKTVAAICHGPQILIDAQMVDGRKLTSVSNIKNDLINAGANWVDEEVVVDQGLITSRTPKDLHAFNDKIIESIKRTHPIESKSLQEKLF